LVVEDDRVMRESLVWLLKTAELNAEAYGLPGELLERYDPDQPGCLVLDLQLSEMTGLELWQRLREKGCRHPFIIISGQGNICTAVQSMHEGAVDFIEKPFDHQRLLSRVRQAIQHDANNRRRRVSHLETQTRIDSLTPREREVMELVVEGNLTKQIAKRLEISGKTVDVHRSHVTKKMHVQSVAQLVRLMIEHSLGNTQ
jgi:two-component system response regulator TtrR